MQGSGAVEFPSVHPHSPLPELEAEALRRHFPRLRLLVLHGSRAGMEAHPESDWDFAYLADPELDQLELRAAIATALRTDDVDLVDLRRAGGLLRYRVARDGKVVLERDAGEFDTFSIDAIRFWLDAAPAIRSGYAAVLESLDA